MTQSIRGSYRKGLETRELILRVALETFSKQGFYATSMREIAKSCQLTQPGLLHHFPTKASLLLEIIEQRNLRQGSLVANTEVNWRQHVLAVAQENTENRTETLLFSTLAAEAEDESHPAHSYMSERYRLAIESFSRGIAREHGREIPNDEDKLRARLVIGVWDGLQLQWLMTPDFDIVSALERALVDLAAGQD